MPKTQDTKCKSCNGTGDIKNKYEGDIVVWAESFPCTKCGGTGKTKGVKS